MRLRCSGDPSKKRILPDERYSASASVYRSEACWRAWLFYRGAPGIRERIENCPNSAKRRCTPKVHGWANLGGFYITPRKGSIQDYAARVESVSIWMSASSRTISRLYSDDSGTPKRVRGVHYSSPVGFGLLSVYTSQESAPDCRIFPPRTYRKASTNVCGF
jgi:hypothetical protein